MRPLGVTLIELLIVIALMGVLSVAGMSFTGRWVDSNRILEGNNLLSQAYSRTKAAALRNEFGMVGDEPAAALCFGNSTLTIYTAKSDTEAASCTPASSKKLWSAPVSERLSVKINNSAGANFSCVCLGSYAQVLTSVSAGCSTCLNSKTIPLYLQSGNENASLPLF